MTIDSENVAEEVQKEEVVHPIEKESVVDQQTPQSSAEKTANDKEYNFKQLREGKKQLEEEVKYLREKMESLVQSKEAEQLREEDSMEIGDDDLAEGRHIKKMMSRVEKMLYQKELQEIPERLKARYADFDEVVSKENIEKLKRSEPEIYLSITDGQDLFAKGISAYKTLKALGIYQPKEDYSKQKDHVQSNYKKPMSVQAIRGQGALHEANVFAQGLTPELKKQLYKEMVEASKSH